jgi:Trk K+ transport system NAD-binding subunit
MLGVRTRHGSFILLRRLRLPLMVLIAVYAVSVLGFTLVPGTAPNGQPWRMSFLHAFYFVSFLGTTIGLGEIPYPFSDAQRLWATASIYATVIAWLYAIGGLFAVLQDPLFRRISHESGRYREVGRLREPFYLLCGYDDTGYRVVHELCEEGVRVVVVDVEQSRVDAADVDDHTSTVPALVGDASDPRALVIAGLTHPQCTAVIALTGSDSINAKVTLTAHLLSPKLPVLSVARDHAWHPRLAAAGADAIINPFDTFAERVAMSIRTPSLHVIYEALTTQAGTAAAQAPEVPRGRWVICGWGLFARALRRALQGLQIESITVDTELDDSCDDSNSVLGNPIEPDVLRRAGIEKAAALVAGTTVDMDNLAIVLAGRSINKQLFIVARQTQRRNAEVFRAAPADLIMLSSYVVAAEMLRHLRDPLLSAFLRRARDEDEDWAAALLTQLRETVGSDVLESWSMAMTTASMPAACDALERGETVSLERVLTRVDGSMERMHAVALLLQRGNERRLLPALQEPLRQGDQILFCGRELARTRMRGIALTRSLAPAASQDRAAAALAVREDTAP